MVEDRSTLVQKVIDTEFNPTLDYPAEGTEMVIYGIMNQERVIESFPEITIVRRY